MSGASVYINGVGLLVIAICGARGFVKGFLSQVISVGAALVGVWMTYRWHGAMGDAVHRWLGAYLPSLQPDIVLVRLGCAVVMFGVLYLTLAAFLEAIKRRVVEVSAVRTSDRLLGLVVGIMKGIVVVIMCVTVLDWGSVYLARVMTADGFERYGQTLNNTEIIAGSRYAVALARIYSPGLSNVLARVEASLPREGSGP